MKFFIFFSGRASSVIYVSKRITYIWQYGHTNSTNTQHNSRNGHRKILFCICRNNIRSLCNEKSLLDQSFIAKFNQYYLSITTESLKFTEVSI